MLKIIIRRFNFLVQCAPSLSHIYYYFINEPDSTSENIQYHPCQLIPLLGDDTSWI